MKPKIFIASSVHRWNDTRIFLRQATSLAKKYEVEFHAPADFDKKSENNVLIVGLPKWNKEIDRVKSWGILLKRVLKSDAAVFHFHDPELIPLGVLVKLLTHKKVIYDVHEHILNDIIDKQWIPAGLRKAIAFLFALLEKTTVPFFDAVIYTTPIVGQRYLQMSKNAVSIENYPMLSFFQGKDGTVEVDQNNDFVYLGRVFYVRGVEEIIRCWPKVVKKYPLARFVIVGDIVPETYEVHLKKLAIDLGLENNVIFCGFVTYDKITQHLDNALAGMVTFLPYKNNMSCLPNKLFEYMANAIPVIASDFPLYRQIVDSAGCGLLVDPTDTDGIAESVISLLEDKTKAKEMGKKGRQAFLHTYNWEKEEARFFQLYDDILQREHFTGTHQ